MTLSELLRRESNDLHLLEAVGDALVDKEAALGWREGTLLVLWIYIAANPEWIPAPVDRSELEAALRVVGEDRLADRLPVILSPPDYKVASQVLKACVRYLRANEAEFELGDDLQVRPADALHPLPIARMAAIFRDAPKA